MRAAPALQRFQLDSASMERPSNPQHFNTVDEPVDLAAIVLGTAGAKSLDDILHDALRAIRLHLGMDVAFISEFVNGRRVFRHIDTHLDCPPIRVGGSEPLDESYCQRVLDGRLPELMHNAAMVPAALELPATSALPIGAHMSVPIRLRDGRLFGTFCCFSFTADPSLQARDLVMMRVFADFAGQQIERHLAAERRRSAARERILAALDNGLHSIVYQPIYSFSQARIVGLEALSRFGGSSSQPPDAWFKEAIEVGLGEHLEIAAIARALGDLWRIPEGAFLALNISPLHVLSGALARALAGYPLARIAIEITEHVEIPDYAGFAAAVTPLRAQGMKLVVDDAGAGYASFRHIVKLKPDTIKLDMSMTRDIDTDRTRRALAAALVRFAQDTGSQIVAEGVQTSAELNVLRELGIDTAQGFLLGHPLPLDRLLGLFYPRH